MEAREKEKGASLIMTFFIMTSVLAVILAVSVILYTELKSIRSMGNSAISFYAADTGIEKALYYDRNIIPEGAKRGLCAIPEAVLEGNDCGSDCSNCRVSFSSTLNADTRYGVVATVEPADDGKSNELKIVSTGEYKGVKRSIAINSSKQSVIDTIVLQGCADPVSSERGETIAINAYAKIDSSTGQSIASVVAVIKKDGQTEGQVELELVDGTLLEGFYSGTWQADNDGVYDVYIVAQTPGEENPLRAESEIIPPCGL